jgi:hypothetical protein
MSLEPTRNLLFHLFLLVCEYQLQPNLAINLIVYFLANN